MSDSPVTIRNIAKKEMERLISLYLELSDDTNNFQDVSVHDLDSRDKITILLEGIRSNADPTAMSAQEAVDEWERRSAVAFDVEQSITGSVYEIIRGVARDYFEHVKQETKNFETFSSEFIYNHPQYLPIFQHIGGFESKSDLKDMVGTVSDTGISNPASKRLADALSERVDPSATNEDKVLSKVERTLEGIVRSLVGKVLLEEVVAGALRDEGVSFTREDEYDALSGVVYDFRSDFVVPDPASPKAFIEVRKSSSRHASLYAKDKMFSAINWKGEHAEMLGIIVVEGPWTESTLEVMSDVFDYVVPLGQAKRLAKTIDAFLSGDKSKLKWIIDFRISEYDK